jgi:SAM-dependent methyltransferase
LPLEQAGELDRRFDLIVCTGVLHHLADPDAGLRALHSVLRPSGALSLMIYAPYGRTGVYMLQDYCRRIGVGTSDEEIRELLATLDALPRNHPLVPLLRGSRDAGNVDALADALLNPRDQSYSVPQLFDFIERNDFTLGRWHWQAPYLPQCGAIALTSHASRLAALPAREQYAAMELWRGTMSSHSVVLHRRDSATEDGLDFDDGSWPSWVPVRLPWTRLIEERLPAGVAGAVMNSSHSYPDLVLMLSPQDRQLLEGIDGRRTISDIAARAHGIDHGCARAFFETLWRYDQVVFDASATPD